MGQIWEQELGVQLMRCGCQWRHIRLEESCARASRELTVVGQLFLAINLLHGRRIPLNLERITPLLGWPVAFGDNGNAFGPSIERYAQHRLDAFDGAGRAVIQRSNFGTEHRRTGHYRCDLSWQAHVNAEILLPAAFGFGIDAGGGLADDAEVFGILERDLLRDWQRHRGFGQFTVACFTTRRAKYGACLCT
ncbi:hypothetical protein D3C81_1326990 [compost metagenome]